MHHLDLPLSLSQEISPCSIITTTRFFPRMILEQLINVSPLYAKPTFDSARKTITARLHFLPKSCDPPFREVLVSSRLQEEKKEVTRTTQI